jgi:hypothetical protein
MSNCHAAINASEAPLAHEVGEGSGVRACAPGKPSADNLTLALARARERGPQPGASMASTVLA